MKLTITQEDINSGERRKCEACPISRAANRQTICHAMTGKDLITLHTAHSLFSPLKLQLPPIARQFVADFDAGREVAPLEFDLPIPAEFCRAAP